MDTSGTQDTHTTEDWQIDSEFKYSSAQFQYN